jgi:hypothetical protein
MHTAKETLRLYLRRLTNLSGNNRSLLLLRLGGDQLIDLHSLSYLNGERSFGIINALIAGKSKKLCQVLDSRLEANNEASVRLKKLQRIDKFIFEERGSHDLHVGWPFVQGKFADGTLVRCPLLYFPVSIAQHGQDWYLEPRKDAGITFNKSFLLAYSYFNKIKIEESIIDFSFEDLDSDSTVFRTQVYQLIKDKLEINFNADNFKDELATFQSYKKDEFIEQQKLGELKLLPEAVVGIFPQAGSQLVPDYQWLIEQDEVLDLEALFASKTDLDKINGRTTVLEENVLTPFPLDAYQEEALYQVKRGKSIVVQGPPGTGKSQLIGNLMADAMAAGKKVLLVCQKRAALDVVYERLSNKGLADFLGLVHDFRNDRRAIYEKIASQIARVDEYQLKNRGIDVIQTERKFLQISRRIDALVEELQNYRTAFFSESECGVSVKELYLTSDPNAPSINLKQEYQYFDVNDIDQFVATLGKYAKYAATYDGVDHLWNRRLSFARFTTQDERAIEDAILEIPVFQTSIANAIEEIIGVSINLDIADSLAQRTDDILGICSVLKNDEVYGYFQQIIDESDDETSMLWLANMERVCLNCFDGELPETTTARDQLGVLQESLQLQIDSKKSLVRWAKWEFFSDSKTVLTKSLERNRLPYDKTGLKTLEKRIDNRLNLEHHITALRSKKWLVNIPEDYHKESFQTWFGLYKLAIRAKASLNSIEELKNVLTVKSLDRTSFVNRLKKLVGVLETVSSKKSEWLKYLTNQQIRQIILKPSIATAFINALKSDFDYLRDYDALKDNLKSYEHDVIRKIQDSLASEINPEVWKSVFQNSLRLAWIDHLETKYPILRMVSMDRMNECEQELQHAIEEKQRLSETILLIKARDLTYEHLTYNRLQNRVTYRDLQHQVTKKKMIWPLRKVIETFADELFKIIPCWLASPESVSAIFPMREIFDLVIFDEASQCFAERGIPSIYRGSQIVIAGDSQQLKPNELYQSRWEEEVDNPDVEIESLLALTERYVSSVHLQGHYRSKSLALIAFSNEYFYKNRLRLLPDLQYINTEDSPIEYHHVEGIWENQTNSKEAQEVVERVFILTKESPEKSVGVVTFNASQQMLILDLMENYFQERNMRIPTTLFVKNIENVQGDERDIIIFSVGYAPDKTGKLKLNFGSLNQLGGENRLNVAVTRSREKIIMITSIDPSQLKVDQAKNLGPVLLQRYLEFAKQVSSGNFVPKPNVNDVRYSFSNLNSLLTQHQQNSTFCLEILPYTDITIIDKEGNYKGAVLTDDVRYYQALTVKEIHAYTPMMLQQKKWPYCTIYSRQYWKHKEKVLAELTTIGT